MSGASRLVASAGLLAALVSSGSAAERSAATGRGVEARLLPGTLAAAQDPARGSGSEGPPTQTTSPPSSNQPQEQQAPPPVFRADINFVRVDVTVTDRSGNPVADLRAEDFEIFEDGEAQKVETFKLIELDGGFTPTPDGPPRVIRSDADEEAEAARDDVRLFGIFLDDYHVRRETSVRAGQELAKLVEAEFGPSDMVSLMYPLEPLASVRFTRNHSAIIGGLLQFEGRKYDYTPRNAVEERYAHYPTETVERIRNQVSMSAIEALVTRMGSLKEGRKALILVSEGYSNMVPLQLRSGIAGVPDPSNPAYGDPTAGRSNSPLENRAEFLAASDMELDLRNIYASASRNNVAIYTFDPRGLSAGEFGIDQGVSPDADRAYLQSTTNTLRTLAAETDGRTFVSRNDFGNALRQIVRDSSAYYLLGYTTSVGATDGKFHEIRVRVRRPGVQVRARKGYWAYSVEAAARATAPPRPVTPRAVETALAAIAPVRSRLVRTWVGAERGENGRTRVTFLWETVPRVPGDPRPASDVPALVTLMAAGADGTPYYRGRVAPPEGGATPKTPPSGSRVTFDARPGQLQLRMSIEGTDSVVLDTETQEVSIPDLTAPQTSLGTPAVFRARTARDFQLLQTNPDAVPTAGREFSRNERVLVRAPVYGPGGSTPTVTARLLNRGGQPVFDLEVNAVPETAHAMEVPVARLAPGEYLIEIKAAGPGGEATQLVAFRLVG